MKVKIKYLPVLNKITGTDREIVELDGGSTVAALVETLASRHGPRFRDTVCHPSITRRYFLTCLLKGKQAGFDTELNEDDEVVFMLPYAGG